MVTKENIPIELYEAFEQSEMGYSLLIKGDAGTGKSTYALTLLSIFKDAEPIYISTRVAPNSIYKQFPWIKERLKEENIIDATRTYLPPINDPGQMKVHVLRTIRFTDAPEFLKAIYDKIEKYESTIVVIDSWDAIVGFSAEKSMEWETILTEFVRQMNIKLILISEHSKSTFLDYIVDGIITLKDNETDNGRVLREMEVNKIRGIERQQKRYNYTLFDNEFIYCSPFYGTRYFKDSSFENFTQNEFESVESSNYNYYSTGSPEIDKLYHGGLKSSSLNLWEIESEVPLSSFSNIMIYLICNFVSKESGTIIYSLDGLNSRFIDKNKLFINLNMEQISQYVKYFVEELEVVDIKRENEIRPYVVPIKMNEFMNTFSHIYEELAEKTSFNPVLSIIGYDFLSIGNDVEDNFVKQLNNHLKFVRNYNVIEIGIFNKIKSNQDFGKGQQTQKNIIEDISFFFDTHIKMIFRNNAIFVYGIKPHSGLYWLKMEYSEDNPLPIIKLIPMV